MNIYRTRFVARCPDNGVRVHYRLAIRSTEVIRVEAISEFVDGLRAGFHEDFADLLHTRFGGEQTLIADHHGVDIETTRNPSAPQYLDQTIGGMAGTPGY